MSAQVHFSFGDEDEVDLNNSTLSRAQGLYLAYMEKLSSVTGDRDAIGRIREDIRVDESFWELGDTIAELTENKGDWINAILRAEGKRAKRMYADKLEELRRERDERLAAEKKAEMEQLMSMPTFGMF